MEDTQLEAALLLQQALHPDSIVDASDITPAVFQQLSTNPLLLSFELEARLVVINQPGIKPRWDVSRRTRRHHRKDQRRADTLPVDREFRREQRAALKALGSNLPAARATWQLLHPDSPPLDTVIFSYFMAEEADLARQCWQVKHYVEALNPSGHVEDFSLHSHSRPMRLGEVMEEIANQTELDMLRRRDSQP